MSFFGLGSTAKVDISFANPEKLRRVQVRDSNGNNETLFMFTGRDSVEGHVHVRLNKDKKLDHTGITVELVGQVEKLYERGSPTEFTSLTHRLAEAGTLTADKTYHFKFSNVEKNAETYYGTNVRLRYFLRARASRSYASNLTKVVDFAVQNVQQPPKKTVPIKMEVGIEDCLHIEFEYNQNMYHLQDVVIGKIYFLLVRIKIKHMELVLIKRESTGSGSNTFNDSENIAKFEIMDGAPVRGESIPVRLFLAPYDLTPTFSKVDNRFSVRYYLNLVLVDEEDRRYFKQQEIVMWRKHLRPLRMKKKRRKRQQQSSGTTEKKES